jgi:hypothetical protein
MVLHCIDSERMDHRALAVVADAVTSAGCAEAADNRA